MLEIMTEMPKIGIDDKGLQSDPWVSHWTGSRS